jgi:CubicO group peptidase (beta-lactamase class C family)
MKQLITTILLLAMIGLNAQSEYVKMLDLEGYYQHLSGNVLVKSGDTVILRSYGLADLEKGQFNGSHIPSDIGSISKQFTAAAILTLVGHGLLSLDDPINQHLGPHASKRWKHVTIHHLLTHTSGIPSLFQSDKGLEEILPTIDSISRSELIGHFSDKKLIFKPGKKYSYSNSGYALLAVIVEQVSRRDFGDFLQEHLFLRYGLNNTSFGSPKQGDYARPYFGYRRDITQSAPLYHPSWMIGAGGIYSTIEDLSNWVDVISGDTFLTPTLRAAYFGKHIAKSGGHYGYGWEIMRNNQKIQHDGTNFGYVSYLGFQPETGDRVIILSNQSYASMDQLEKSAQYILDLKTKIWRSLSGEKWRGQLPAPASAALKKGEYVFNDSIHISIEQKDSVFFVNQSGEIPVSRLSHVYSVEGTSIYEQRLIRITRALSESKFRLLKPECDKQMRLAVKLGIISLGFKMITSDIGKLLSGIPFFADDDFGLIRFYGEKGAMDMIVYFDDEGLMQGIFDHGLINDTAPEVMLGFPVEGNRIFVDGFPYGEASYFLKSHEDGISMSQFNREFMAKVRTKN